MINPIDRTQDFIRALSLHHSVPSTPSATLKSTWSRPQNEQSEPYEFTETALGLTSGIEKMEQTIRDAQTRYQDFTTSRAMTDTERDVLDTKLSTFLSGTLSSIDVLKAEAVTDVQTSRGASYPVHKLGVVIILNDKLSSLSKSVELIRSCRIRNALLERQRSNQIQYDAKIKQRFDEELVSSSSSPRFEDEDDNEDDSLLIQQFERENLSLVNDLVQTREQVREAERTVHTIANMNQLFATKVLQQAREIETLYDLAVEATGFVDRGNRELRKMERSGPVAKYGLAALAFLLAMLLLVLEWIGRRRIL